MHQTGGGGETHRESALAGGQAQSQGHVGLAGAAGVPRQLPLPESRRLFLPVHIPFLTPLPSLSSAVAGDVESQEARSAPSLAGSYGSAGMRHAGRRQEFVRHRSVIIQEL